MFVIPSIDILDGKCVQLIGGRRETATIYGTPTEWLAKWTERGADLIHVIDLDAALGTGSNRKQVFELIKNAKVDIQIGGGIRSERYARELIDAGAKRVIIGSKAMDIDFLAKLSKHIPKERIMAALDTRARKVVVDGWQTSTEITFEELARKIRPYIGSLLSTNVDVEGTLGGTNKEWLKVVARGGVPVYASGGFTTKKDIETAEKLGFSGIVIGMALYTQRLRLEELW